MISEAALKNQSRRFFLSSDEMTRYHCWNRRLKEVAAMKQKAYRQNPTVIDLSKKARPPPGETTLIYMNCLIIWILLTMPMRPSGLFGRAHFVRSKNFWRNFKKSSAFLKNAVLPREKGGSTTNFPTRKEVRMWNLIAGSFRSLCIAPSRLQADSLEWG